MKKTTFMTLALLMVSALVSISLVSCSSDDDEGGLSGRWIEKGYLSKVSDHYNEWKTGKRGIVQDGMLYVYEFSGSSVKLYSYIYTFDGTFGNWPDRNNEYKRLGENPGGYTWYYYLRRTDAYVLKDNAIIMSDGTTGVYENGKLYIGSTEYEKIK